MTEKMTVKYLQRNGQPSLAYVKTPGDTPCVVFLGGFMSDMDGTKAVYLEQSCTGRGQAFLRFDYSGHGKSQGRFEEGTIGNWLADALCVIDTLAGDGPLVLVGSSMGGWIALLAALQRPQLVRGLVGIAAAPDFTRALYRDVLSDSQRKELEEKGQTEMPNAYDDRPYIITRALIEDGDAQSLLYGGRKIGLDIPVRLVQGMQDDEVPWQKAREIQEAVTGKDVEVSLVEQGDHRLSRPEDLMLLDRQVQNVTNAIR